jgi:tRNA-specific 2-thiouridylase
MAHAWSFRPSIADTVLAFVDQGRPADDMSGEDLPVNNQNSKPRRVVVALSGGVDSSTAAALLVQRGYQVSGVMMRLWATHYQGDMPENRCCSPAAVADARQVCALLGIPFQLVDLEEEFKTRVVDYFCDTYALGRTPNPCLACNRYIKFKALLRLAFDLGAEFLATGHYARIRSQNGEYQLLKGIDSEKDQSYVLYMLGQEELPHVLFPLGDYTKRQVRAMAAEYNLATADKLESQDACFVSDGDYRAFLAQQRPATIRPGPILDLQGRALGEHRGVAFYTVGQRQGLGITAAHPLYVLEIDSARNALIAGPKAALFRRELRAEQVHFVAGSLPPQPVSITAKIRYKAQEAPATMIPLPGQMASVVFADPQPAITPGQGVVFYQDDTVLGGGIIASAGPVEV